MLMLQIESTGQVGTILTSFEIAHGDLTSGTGIINARDCVDVANSHLQIYMTLTLRCWQSHCKFFPRED